VDRFCNARRYCRRRTLAPALIFRAKTFAFHHSASTNLTTTPGTTRPRRLIDARPEGVCVFFLPDL